MFFFLTLVHPVDLTLHELSHIWEVVEKLLWFSISSFSSNFSFITDYRPSPSRLQCTCRFCVPMPQLARNVLQLPQSPSIHVKQATPQHGRVWERTPHDRPSERGCRATWVVSSIIRISEDLMRNNILLQLLSAFFLMIRRVRGWFAHLKTFPQTTPQSFRFETLQYNEGMEYGWTLTSRYLVCTRLLPHDAEHSPHDCQSVIKQSTGHSIRQRTYWGRSTSIPYSAHLYITVTHCSKGRDTWCLTGNALCGSDASVLKVSFMSHLFLKILRM